MTNDDVSAGSVGPHRLSRLLLRHSVEVMIEIDRAVGGYGVPSVCGQASVNLFNNLPVVFFAYCHFVRLKIA
jgi:hypothetical protein